MPFTTGHDVGAANFSLVRTAAGDAPDGSGANKLWLPLWSGEVINAYDQFNVFENMITTRTIASGFSYEFPMTGTVELNSSWDAGEELIGGSSTSTSFKVNLDKRPMAAHFETDNIDMLVTQWDYRSELARQAGLTLANTRDRQVAMALLAACSVGQIANDARGLAAAAFQDPGIISTSILASGSVTDAEGLKVLQEIENYLVTCQENDIPVENVYCAVTPKVFQVIRALGIPRSSGGTVATATALNYNGALFGGSDDYGGAGASISVGMNSLMDSLDYMGVKIIKTNHLAKVDHNVTANNIGSSKYNLNAGANSYAGSNGQGFSSFSVYGIIFQTPAVAGLSLQGMKVDTVQDVRRNTQFTVASMMKGTGLIRPEMCKALISGTTPTGGTPVTTAGREGLRNHLNGNLASGTTAHNNLTNGFAAEYAQA